MIFDFMTVAMSIVCAIVFGLIGLLVAKVISLKEEVDEADAQIYELTQELKLFKNEADKEKELNYDWMCDLQDKIDDLSKWADMTECQITDAVDAMREARETQLYRRSY